MALARAELLGMASVDHLSAWDRLWPLLVTAGLSLFVLAVVQLAVIPRLEARKRREDRWEEDLLALGEMLTFEFADAASEYGRAIWTLSMLREESGGEDIDEYVAEKRAAFVEGHHAYSRTRSRVMWLAERIRSLDPERRPLFRLWADCWQMGHGLDVVSPYFRTGEKLASTEEVDKRRSEQRDRISGLVKSVQTLLSEPPPRKSMWVQRTYWNRRAIWKKGLAKRKAAKAAQALPPEKTVDDF